jgi:signal peptidase I
MRKLHWGWALLASLATPGLGQVYNGQALRGIVALTILFALYANMLAHFGGTYPGLCCSVAAALLWVLTIHVDAAFTAIRSREAARKGYHHWYVYLAAVALFWGAYSHWRTALVYRPYRIPSIAMSPTLQPGDLVMATNTPPATRILEVGDVVVFTSPLDPSAFMAKRVVAFSGDQVEIRNKVLFVNGVARSEPYACHTAPDTLGHEESPRDNFGPFPVQEGTCFVLGDNRDDSRDSRFMGPVARANIKGRVLYIYGSKVQSRIGKRL